MALNHNKYMRLAIAAADIGIELGNGGPFGAVVVSPTGKVIGVGSNTVLRDSNPTGHAEINAIRKATQRLGSWRLENCYIYTTTEPCAMCAAACHWARIDRIYYGTSKDEVKAFGFSELPIGAKEVLWQSKWVHEMKGRKSLKACRRLLQRWQKNSKRVVY